jgi:hypothetical protein
VHNFAVAAQRSSCPAGPASLYPFDPSVASLSGNSVLLAQLSEFSFALQYFGNEFDSFIHSSTPYPGHGKYFFPRPSDFSSRQ